MLLASCIIVLGGCQKGELRENNVSDESKVAIELSAGSPVSVVSKAAVEKWNDSEVNVFGLKRKRGIAVGDNAYDFTDPDSFVDYPTTAAAGTSASLEVYADKEKEIPYFYTEGHVYDFYGYHLGGATATEKNISGDTYSYFVTFLGNNDLMYADTDRAEDILTSNDPSVTESDVYSAWAARRNIHPTLVFHHALTRLNFIVKGKGNKWQDVAITGVDVKSVNTGTLAVTGTDIGFTPSEETPAVLSLKTAADENLVSEDVTLNPDDVALGGEGACLIIAPDVDEIEVTVHMKHKDYEDIPLADYTFTVKASDVSNKDEYGNAVPVSLFEAGHAYDFYINVYGPEEIVITAQITDWEDGGDYTYDPDDDFRPGNGTDPEPEPEALHKVMGVQVYDDGQYYGVIKFGYDEQDRLTSIEAVYDNNTYFSAFDYSDEDIVKITGVLGDDDDLPTIVIYDSDGTVSSIGDWEFTYYPEENKIVLYDDAEAIWYLEDGNVIAVYDKYDDVTQSYDYYAYKNNYSIDMNNILAVIAEWDYNYAPLPPFRLPSFTSANLLKQGKYGTYSYEFDEDGKVSSIEMISANVTYTLEPHYDSFDEIFDAFPELPSEEQPETINEVAGLRYYEDGACIGVVKFEYDENGRQTRYEAKVQEKTGSIIPISVLYEYHSDYVLRYLRLSEDNTLILQPIKISFDSEGRVESLLREYDKMEVDYEYSDGLVTMSVGSETMQLVQIDGNILGEQDGTYNEYYSFPNNYSVDLCNVLYMIRDDDYYLYSPFFMYRVPGLTSANLLKSGANGQYGIYSYEFDEQDRVSMITVSESADDGGQKYEVEVYYDDFDEVYDSFGSVVVSSEEKIVKNAHVVTSSGMGGPAHVTIDYDFSYDADRHVEIINVYGDSGDDEDYMWLNISRFDQLSGSYDTEEWLSDLYQWTMSYDFDENGLPVSCQRSVEYDSDELSDLFSSTFLSGDTETISYYADGHVMEIADSYAPGTDSYDTSVRFSWRDGNIVSESYLLPGDSEYTTVNYEYSSVEDKTNIDLTRLTYSVGVGYRGGHYISDKSMFKGFFSRFLPSRTEDVDGNIYDWTYKFDDQGYVTEISVESDYYSERMYIEYY